MTNILSTFMSIVITAVILSVLIFGVVYEALTNNNTNHRDTIKEEYNLQLK